MDLSPAEEELIRTVRRAKMEAEITFRPPNSDDIPISEKVIAFNKLFKMALDHFNQVKEQGERDDDSKQWFFEAVMELLGKDVWKAYNKYLQ